MAEQPAPIDAHETGINDHLQEVGRGLQVANGSILHLNNRYLARNAPVPVSVYRHAMEDVVEGGQQAIAAAQKILAAIEENKA